MPPKLDAPVLMENRPLRVKEEPRFAAALATLEATLDEAGRVIVERPHRGLKGLKFCARGQPFDLATQRYREIRKNLTGPDLPCWASPADGCTVGVSGS